MSVSICKLGRLRSSGYRTLDLGSSDLHLFCSQKIMNADVWFGLVYSGQQSSTPTLVDGGQHSNSTKLKLMLVPDLMLLIFNELMF